MNTKFIVSIKFIGFNRYNMKHTSFETIGSFAQKHVLLESVWTTFYGFEFFIPPSTDDFDTDARKFED